MFIVNFSRFVSLFIYIIHVSCYYIDTEVEKMGDFKNVFKNLRIKSGYTQDGLAEALGISRSAISMYETGNREPDFETLEQIADFFNVDMNFLLGKSSTTTVINKIDFEPSYADVEQLIARNGKEYTTEQKMRLIKLLSEID